MRIWLFCLLTFWSGTALAQAPDLRGNFTQGGLVQGVTVPGTKIEFQGRVVRVDDNGRFIFGFGRDFPKTAPLYWTGTDGIRHSRILNIKARTYKTEKIKGLPAKKVTPPKDVLARIRRENKLISAVRRKDSAASWFESGFAWPLPGRISGVYGSQRILNDKPRRPHYGLDIAAKTGSPVHTSTDGRVALAERDLFYTGGTVMLDHGHGLTSVYMHLNSVTVKVGQFVRQGEQIGTVGKTGRASGPHLDWRLNWFNQRLDPGLLLGPKPK
ncbi:MAG: M23 family metallopeptidase [Rhodospirillaceae bacterium]|jgi:murein DD-endopeptidase MepM/ murein hydrolase activator NlpD|nr:M23 family metallopeptidase [Rhodospirillaceae bacterium]MBT4687814.1 M23 family metallopeptidase [Rhodospirillaceae bacterium]MBT5082380.1 M23 family metallopeptidase [Rhodospirillaceae bacterium]MBT5524582.1 M23 family metallopeptidase [Rhodospirillaceae bacterium]MBT5878551.1 M23 family metallopeptidase [Rhodospirillaceae bacterium]